MLSVVVIETELKAMQAKRDELRNAFWQADGACQALEQLLSMARRAAEPPPDEGDNTLVEAAAPDES